MARDQTPPPDRVDVNKCLQMIRSGEPEQVDTGWRKIDERYRPDLLRLALRLLDGNTVHADDVAQETLIQIWRTFPRFRGASEAEFTKFVLVTGYHRACDIGKQLTKERNRSARDYEEGLAKVRAMYGEPDQSQSEHPTKPHPAQKVVDRPSTELDQLDPPLEHALNELTPKQRQCVDLARRGSTREETAKALGTSLSAVYAHLSNARTKLMPYYLARRLIKRRSRGATIPT